jgi:hypothetical protein
VGCCPEPGLPPTRRPRRWAARRDAVRRPRTRARDGPDVAWNRSGAWAVAGKVQTLPDSTVRRPERDAGLRSRWSAAGRGSVMVKRAPCAGRESASIVPPCALISSLTVTRPMPVPPTARPAPPRQNRSKICGSSSGPMPGPVSATSMRAAVSHQGRGDGHGVSGRAVACRVAQQVAPGPGEAGRPSPAAGSSARAPARMTDDRFIAPPPYCPNGLGGVRDCRPGDRDRRRNARAHRRGRTAAAAAIYPRGMQVLSRRMPHPEEA